MKIRAESRIDPTPRVMQLRGMFDLPESPFARTEWDIDATQIPPTWAIGLITGPSGSGKSYCARALFPAGPRHLWADTLPAWPKGKAVIDGFPLDLPLKECTALLSSVGFSSPPAWIQDPMTLSVGQLFRATLARLLALTEPDQVAVCDEFTSTVDRQVARVGCAAVSKAIRSRGLKFVAVTCHDDVIEWLQPDWVLTPSNGVIARRSLSARPAIPLDIFRTSAQAWPAFARHHYLSHTLSSSATCFAAESNGTPVGFSAWVNHLTALGGKREHRTVILPDWQGVGIGMVLSSTIASMWKALNQRAVSTTTHPAFIQARLRSNLWKLSRAPNIAGGKGSKGRGHATMRATAGFEYIGPPMNPQEAAKLLGT